MIFLVTPVARITPGDKNQDGASGGITVPPDWPIQRIYSTLPATRSADIERKGLGGGIRQAFVIRSA